jgi:hypothetical protein
MRDTWMFVIKLVSLATLVWLVVGVAEARAGKPDFWGSYAISQGEGVGRDTLFTLHIVRGENHHQWWESRYLQYNMEREWRDMGGLRVREYMKNHSGDWVLCLIRMADGDTIRLCDATFLFRYGAAGNPGGGPPWDGSLHGRSLIELRCIDYIFTDTIAQFEVLPGKHSVITLPSERIEDSRTRTGFIPVWIAFEQGALKMDHNKDGEGIESPFSVPRWVGLENGCSD